MHFMLVFKETWWWALGALMWLKVVLWLKSLRTKPPNSGQNSLYSLSGIRGVGGVTTVQPAFLNISICRRVSIMWAHLAAVLQINTRWQHSTDLPAGPIRVGQHQPRADDVKCGVDVHGVWVFEGDDVDLVGGSEVTSHPLDAREVCNLSVKTCQQEPERERAVSSERMRTLTWLLCTKISVPALMKSAASKHGSNSVVTNFPWAASLCLSSTVRMG